MHSIVANDADDIQRLLNLLVLSLLHKRANIIIDVPALGAKMYAGLLQGQTQQRSCASRRL